MKYLLIILTFLYSTLAMEAQVTNLKAGLWSDVATWSNGRIPVYTDMISLDFDLVVDINATCKSLNNNGHRVTINSGVTLNIVGSDSKSIDTSVIFIKTTIDYRFQKDSLIQVFRNNKINGIKGFIVKERYTYFTPTTTKFTYNNLGQLNSIITSADTMPSEPLSTATLTWDKSKISHIKYDEHGSIGMDRNYNYLISNDTLLIRYRFNIGRDLYLDSSNVTIYADTGTNKIYRLSKEGEFDFAGLFDNDKGTFNEEKKFEYSGKNITSVNYSGQKNYSAGPYAYVAETDSSVCYFTRQTQVNTFLADVEEDMFGKEFKMLCYDQTDSIADILDEYFTSGDWYANDIQIPEDNFQYANVLNWSLDPVTESSINYTVRRDGVIYGQQSGFLYKKLIYTLDTKKRITAIKGYDAATNDLISETDFLYP